MGRANAGPLDHLPDPPTDRLGDAPQSVLLGVRTVAGPGTGEGQDGGDRCHDAGGQRRDALDRAAGQWGKLRGVPERFGDRKSTRLNSSHGYISYAVFCLKKKKTLEVKIYRVTRDMHESICHG